MSSHPPDDRAPPPPPAPSPREELEARLTALILGEAGDFEAETLRARIAADPDLAALHRRLEAAATALTETLHQQTSTPATNRTPLPGTPVHLSADRRAALTNLFGHDSAPALKPDSPKATPASQPARFKPRFIAQILAAAACLALMGWLLLGTLGNLGSRSNVVQLAKQTEKSAVAEDRLSSPPSAPAASMPAEIPAAPSRALSASELASSVNGPSNATVNDLLAKGRAQYLYGDYQNALKTFSEAAILDPNPTEASAYILRIEKLLGSAGYIDYQTTRVGAVAQADNNGQRPAVAVNDAAATSSAKNDFFTNASDKLGASSTAASNLVLNGGNLSYSGAGVVDLGHTVNFTTGPVAPNTLAQDAKKELDAGQQIISGTGNITLGASLSRNLTNGGGIFRNGLRRVDSGIDTGLSGTNAPTLTRQTGAGTTVSIIGGVVDGGTNPASFNKSGAGTLTLTGNNTYTGGSKLGVGPLDLQGGKNTYAGGITVSAGTVALRGDNTFSGGTVQLGTRNALADNEAFNFNGPDANGTGKISFAGSSDANQSSSGAKDGNVSWVIGGIPSGELVKNGTGTFTPIDNSAYTGTTTITGGNLTLGNGSTSGALSTPPTTAAATNIGGDLRSQTDSASLAPPPPPAPAAQPPPTLVASATAAPGLAAGGGGGGFAGVGGFGAAGGRRGGGLGGGGAGGGAGIARGGAGGGRGGAASGRGAGGVGVRGGVLRGAPGAPVAAAPTASESIGGPAVASAPASPGQRAAASRAGVTISAGTPENFATTETVNTTTAAPLLAATSVTTQLAGLDNTTGGDVLLGIKSAPANDQPLTRPASAVKFPPPVAAAENPFSTFALNVNDVSYRLALAALQHNQWPDPANVRTEEFLNAFKYNDPAPGRGEPCTLNYDLAQNPFEAGSDLLRVSFQTAATGRDRTTPLRLTILLDNSGSMTRADREAILAAALQALGAQLRAGDTVSLVSFARTPTVRATAVPAARFSEVLQLATTLVPDGGTNLEEALHTAYATAKNNFDPAAQNRVVLLTDGAANLGDVNPQDLADFVDTNRRAGIAFDAYGVGWDGLDDTTLEALTRHGDGRYAFLNSPADVDGAFARQLAGALAPAALDVKLQLEFNPARVTSYRLMGYNNLRLTAQQFRDNTVDAGELAAAEQGTALYSLMLNPQGSGVVGTARARFRDPATGQTRELSWTIPYRGAPAPFDLASPAMRLAAVAGYFAEYLQRSPYAGGVTPRRLLDAYRGVPEAFAPDQRPVELQNLLRAAGQLDGQ